MITDLERWLSPTLEKLSRKSDTAAAILYALNLWPALSRYCDDVRIEIDNMAAERALRESGLSSDDSTLPSGKHSLRSRAATSWQVGRFC